MTAVFPDNHVSAAPRFFIYCVEATGGGIAKVGTSDSPRSRLNQLHRVAPFALRFRHCLEVASRGVADGWERIILSEATRYRQRGEWVVADAHLDDLFGCVTDAVCALDEMSVNATAFGRVIRAQSDAFSGDELARAAVIAQTGIIPPSFCGDREIGIIHARLQQGYGAEDCQVMDGINAEDFRREVHQLRMTNRLLPVLRGRATDKRVSA